MITLEESTKKPAVIGTFEGECADSTITNLNGLDITREVWETVFASDDYKKALSNGWYIGYLGHPEDPNCMDFQNACIVMTECHIEDNGKIQGKFDLVDTPVGRIVKSFIDAGVTFGISVRGAGDVVNNSVDPDTFVFRGFDLVSFPAYPDAIPTFTQIAASSDAEKQQKYKAVCSAVNANVDSLNTVAAIDIVQANFAKQSHEYANLEARKKRIMNSSRSIKDEKIDGLVDMYIEASKKIEELENVNKQLMSFINETVSKYSKKYNSIRRIMQSQSTDFNDLSEEYSKNESLLNTYKARIAAKDKRIEELKDSISGLRDENLKYRRKISESDNELKKKDRVIASIQSDYEKTVQDSESSKLRASNLDESNRRLRETIRTLTSSLHDYQNAYANIYANAIGADLDSVTISNSTSVDDLQKSILGSRNTSEYSNNSDFEFVDVVDDADDYSDDAEIVTI